MTDVRRYNPSQERDPDGKWGDGSPGPQDFFDMAGFHDVVEVEGTFGDLALGVDDAGDVRLAFRERGQVVEMDLGADDMAELGDALEELAAAREDLPDDADPRGVYDDRRFGFEGSHKVELFGSGVLAVTFGAEEDDPATLHLDPPDDGDEDEDVEPTDDVSDLLAAIDEVLQGGTMGGEDTTRSFQPEEHPRAPAGTETGGQFAKGGGGGQKKATPKPGPRRRPAASNTLAYDAATGQGTGYDSKDGDPRVHDLQRALNRLGVKDSQGKPLRDDGQLGPKTTSAVKALQRKLGLKPDGKVTPALLQQIKSMKSLPMKRSAFMDFCVRSYGFEFETRGRSTGDGRTLEGYAAVFNSPTRIAAVGGDFDEVITPGAFTRSIRSRMPVLQFEHGRDPRIGAAPIGAIEDLSEDSKGLHVRATLFDHPDIERVRQGIAARAITGMSFRFQVVDGGDRWERRASDVDLRTVGDADVHELGPVVFPAYDTTTVSVRSLLAQLGPEEHRALLRELAYDLRSAEHSDLTGQSAARSGDGGDTGAEPEHDARPAPKLHLRQRLDDGALRARGILL